MCNTSQELKKLILRRESNPVDARFVFPFGSIKNILFNNTLYILFNNTKNSHILLYNYFFDALIGTEASRERDIAQRNN